jgi:hypothetical protein
MQYQEKYQLLMILDKLIPQYIWKNETQATSEKYAVIQNDCLKFVGKKLHDIEFGDNFLDMTPKPQAPREK